MYNRRKQVSLQHISCLLEVKRLHEVVLEKSLESSMTATMAMNLAEATMLRVATILTIVVVLTHIMTVTMHLVPTVPTMDLAVDGTSFAGS